MEEKDSLAKKILLTEQIKSDVEELKSIKEIANNVTHEEREKFKENISKLENNIVRKQKKLLDTTDINRKVNDILEKKKEIMKDKEVDNNTLKKEQKKNTNIKISKSENQFNLKKYKKFVFFALFGLLLIMFMKKMGGNEEVVKEEETIEIADVNAINIKDIEETDEDKPFTLDTEKVKVASNNPMASYELIDKDEYERRKKAEDEKIKNGELNQRKTVLVNDKDDEEIKKIDKQIEDLNNTFGRENNNSNNSDEVKNESMSFYKKDINNIDIKNKNTTINNVNKIMNGKEYSLMQGSIIPALLITQINTDLPGDIIAQVRENVFDTRTGNVLLIPKGSRLYGRYNASLKNGQKRVMIAFDKIILPNGKYINLSSMNGTDNLGMSGVKDKVDNHIWELLGNAFLSSILNFTDTAVSVVANKINPLSKIGGKEGNGENSNGTPFKKATGKILERSIERKPTLTIRKGFLFNILVNGDIEIEKYKY